MSAEVKQIITEHTKKEYPDERNQAAAEFRQKRRPYFEERENVDAKIKNLTAENQALRAANEEVREKIVILENESERRKESILHQIIQVFTKDPYGDPYLRKRRRESTRLKIHLEGNQDLIRKNKKRVVKLKETEVDTTPLESAEAAVGQFYKEHARNFLTSGQKKELFNSDFLAELDLNEFMTLWRAGSPYYLSHVSRHGFRDHTGGNVMIPHSAGLAEFTDGFTRLLEEGKMKSAYERQGLDDINEETVEQFLKEKGLLDVESREIALQGLNIIIKGHPFGGSAPEYPDQSAVHLAAETVLDNFYGGEANNEVLVVYPADFIASQTNYAFNGWEEDFTRPQSEAKWNDIFVWGDVPLDAGVVFLPKSTPVDPETGSKYKSHVIETEENSNSNRVMEKNPEAKNDILTWWETNKERFGEFYRNYDEEPERLYDNTRRRKYAKYQREVIRSLTEIGVTGDVDSRVIDMVSHYFELDIDFVNSEEKVEEFIDLCHLRYRRAKNPVSSQEFWEDYFSKNPESRPKRVFYYEGTPAVAVRKFLESHGLVREGQDEPLLGFETNHVPNMQENPRANEGKEKFERLLRETIDRYFPPQDAF